MEAAQPGDPGQVSRESGEKDGEEEVEEVVVKDLEVADVEVPDQDDHVCVEKVGGGDGCLETGKLWSIGIGKAPVTCKTF